MDVGPDALVEIVEERTVPIHQYHDAGGEYNIAREKVRDQRINHQVGDTIARGLRD